MADRTKIETGNQQRTNLDEFKGLRRPDRDYAENPRLDSNEELSSRDDDAINEAQNRALRENRRDNRVDEKIPSDTRDPESGRTPGKKNPHQP